MVDSFYNNSEKLCVDVAQNKYSSLKPEQVILG